MTTDAPTAAGDGGAVDPVSSLSPGVSKAHRKLAGRLLDELGLSPGQELLLMLLWEESPRTQADLIRLLMVEPPTTAKMLARLEKSGFVAREQSTTDGRVVLVRPTPAGRDLEGPVTTTRAQLEELTTADLSNAEREQLGKLLSRVGETLVSRLA